MKFETGKYYRRQDKQKALCVYVWPNGTAAFVLADTPMCSWVVGIRGNASAQVTTGFDIIGEWREPRKWKVWLIECPNGVIDVLLCRPTQPTLTVRAIVEVTEGDGL